MDYNAEAKRIIGLIKTEFLLDNGIPFLEKEEGRIFKHHIFPDLGDYLPFFIYYSENDFVEKQIDVLKTISKDGLLVSDFPTFRIHNLAKSYEYTDLLLGLMSYYKYKNDNDSKLLFETTLDCAIKIFKLNGRVSSFFIPKYNFNFPITDTRDGTFIEILVEASEVLNKNEYVSTASSIYVRLISSRFYKKYSLFPSFSSIIPMIGPGFNSAVICKNTTNTLFSFLALYKKTLDFKIITEIDKILISLEQNASVGDFGIVKEFVPGIKNHRAFLTASFPVVDFLCDLYCEVKDKKYIKIAKKISDFWISLQGATGLFPLYSDGKETFLDSETDMVVALTKLAELTGDKKYFESAEKCFDGIIKYHAKNNYVLSVDCNTGEVTNKTQRTKFITLFLKLLIAKDYISKGQRITENSWLNDLLKDR